MQFDRKVNFVTKTDGRGYWSETVKTVKIYRIILVVYDDDDGGGSFGELRAYFTPQEWSVDNDGLIYSDQSWMKSFKRCMTTLGFSKAALDTIHYSEQGMQGETYVSMDVTDPFITECTPLYQFAVNKQAINI